MPRLQKDVVSYFPHDAGASTGDTLTILQNRFGNNGYAFWFKLLEKLAAAEGHYLDCRTPVKWQLLLAKTGVNELTGVEIMNLLVEMNAIDKELWESRLIWCQNLVDNLAEVYRNRRRELPQKPVNTKVNPITTPDNALTTPAGTQSKVEYSKVEYNTILLRFDEFWKIYPNKKAKGDAEKAFIKLKPDNGLLEVILTAVETAKKSAEWLKDNGRYIPHPATWLNTKRWEDEFEETKLPKSKFEDGWK